MFLRAVLCVLLFASTNLAAQPSQATLERLRKELVTQWIVDVDGEPRTRTLNIKSIHSGSDERLPLDATYGWSDGNQTAIKADLAVKGESLSISLVTQARSQISVERQPDGQFAGTFRWESGRLAPVVLTRVLEGQAVATQAYRVIQPDPEVPLACAALAGAWTGNWSFGQRWLWVIEVEKDCKAKYSYGAELPRALKSAQVVDGTLRIPCGASGGTCSFWRSGSDLYGRYAGSDGGNNTVFRADPKYSTPRRQ